MKRFLLVIPFFLLSICSFAQIDKAIPPKPSAFYAVADYAKILTAQQIESLNEKLIQYKDSTTNEIAIVTVEDLKGYEANEFATALGRKWGVGGSEFNNGIVILISTGGGDGNRDAYIAVGYGLEGAIPDITAKSILDNELIPNFKNGNYYRGLDEATDAIIKAAAGEYKAPPGYGKTKKGIGIARIIFIIIFLIILFAGGGRGGGFGTGWIIGSMMSGGGRGGWSGGGGGGGFGGFGGGSFGGGGAGGKW